MPFVCIWNIHQEGQLFKNPFVLFFFNGLPHNAALPTNIKPQNLAAHRRTVAWAKLAKLQLSFKSQNQPPNHKMNRTHTVKPQRRHQKVRLKHLSQLLMLLLYSILLSKVLHICYPAVIHTTGLHGRPAYYSDTADETLTATWSRTLSKLSQRDLNWGHCWFAAHFIWCHAAW